MHEQVAVMNAPLPGRMVAAAALCTVLITVPEARAQVAAGPVRIDVSESARSSATARAILTAVGIAERVVRDRRETRGGTGRPEGNRGAGGSGGRARSAPAARVLPTAERYLGVPYKWGGTSPKTGFDCSGFVQYVFAKHGTRLPRTSREMATSGDRLRPAWLTLRPGDLVLFAEPGQRISHVAIYAGDRRIIHATSSGRAVRYDELDTKRGKWFAERLVAARRVSANGDALVSELLAEYAPEAKEWLELDPPDRAPATVPDR